MLVPHWPVSLAMESLSQPNFLGPKSKITSPAATCQVNFGDPREGHDGPHLPNHNHPSDQPSVSHGSGQDRLS